MAPGICCYFPPVFSVSSLPGADPTTSSLPFLSPLVPFLLAASPLPANMLMTPSSHSELLLTALSPSNQFPFTRKILPGWASPGSISLLTTALTVLTAFLEYNFLPYFSHPCCMESWLTPPQTLSHMLQAQSSLPSPAFCAASG